MKIYYLDHPEHGTHVCYSESDVKIAEKNGWILRKDEPVIVEKEEKPHPAHAKGKR